MAICMKKITDDSDRTLHPYLSPVDVWALSVGSAIGWIVDTTTIVATIIYGFASFAVFKIAKREDNKKELEISSICIVINQ